MWVEQCALPGILNFESIVLIIERKEGLSARVTGHPAQHTQKLVYKLNNHLIAEFFNSG
jgi:hypothetical protein